MENVKDFLSSAVSTFLVPFAMAIDSSWNANWHHELIATRLERALEDLMVRNLSTNLIIQVPPRHGKSEEVTIKFPAWALGKYPDLPVAVASYSSDLAEDFGLKTRDTMDLEEFKTHFETRLRPDSAAKARWLTMKRGPMDEEGEYELVPAKGSFTAVGIGGALTGRGFKIGIVDDPIKNRKEAESETVRNTLWGWYKSTFRTRQEGAAIKIIVNTRWHLGDLAGLVLKQEQDDIAAGIPEEQIDHWEVISFPAIAVKDELPYRRKGQVLWPEKFDLTAIQKTKHALGTYEFEALYQQNPIPSEKQEFKEAWFQYYDPEDLRNKTLDHNTTVDLAIGEAVKDDETSLCTVGKEFEHPEWYLRPFQTGHFNPGETITKLFSTVKLYRSNVGLETVQYQRALKYFITEKQREKEFYFNVVELKQNNHTSKEVRIRGLIPLMEAGVIKMLRGPVHEKLRKQMLDFPQGEHDDELDALASQLEMWGTTAFEEQKERRDKRPPEDEPRRISDLQGTMVPTVNGEGEGDGVLDDIDVGTMKPKEK